MARESFSKQMSRTLRQLKKVNYAITQEVIKTVTEEIKEDMQNATVNVNTGKFKDGWKIKQYKNQAYVYNGPLTNIVEYSSRGPRPFIFDTFRQNEARYAKSVVNNFNKKYRRN